MVKPNCPFGLSQIQRRGISSDMKREKAELLGKTHEKLVVKPMLPAIIEGFKNGHTSHSG